MVPATISITTEILIGIGANLVPDGFDTPRSGCEAAIGRLPDHGIDVIAVSSWFETAPVPASDQPWFNNAVIAARTSLSMHETLRNLHRVESEFGRVRAVRNEARVLDMDLLDFGGVHHHDDGVTLPHPRMHQRAFVLLPLRDLAPDYIHPVSGMTVDHLIEALPADQLIRRM